VISDSEHEAGKFYDDLCHHQNIWQKLDHKLQKKKGNKNTLAASEINPDEKDLSY